MKSTTHGYLDDLQVVNSIDSDSGEVFEWLPLESSNRIAIIPPVFSRAETAASLIEGQRDSLKEKEDILSSDSVDFGSTRETRKKNHC